MTQLNIDSDAMTAVIAHAVLESITPENRDELLTNAVQSLLSAPTDQSSMSSRYGNKPATVLQDCFNDAIRKIAEEIATEHLCKVEQRERIRELVVEGVSKALGDSPHELGKVESEKDTLRTTIINNIANGVRKGLTGESY